jgi:hypothetical protein
MPSGSIAVDRPVLPFVLRWGAWLSEPRPSQTLVLIVKRRAPTLSVPDVGYSHRGRQTFR